MKKIYIDLLLISVGALTLTSCSTRYKFVTEGLPEKDSSYLVTNTGAHIEAQKIEVRPSRLTVDGHDRSYLDLSGIKSKKMYFSIADSDIYLAEIYGKINWLYKLSYGTSYSPSYAPGTSMYNAFGAGGSQTVVVKNYFLQKQGFGDVVPASKVNYYEYLRDNEKALTRIHGAYTWRHIGNVSAVGFGAGVIGVFVGLLSLTNDKYSNLSKFYAPSLELCAVSFPTYVVSNIIANHKTKKAIKIYNRP